MTARFDIEPLKTRTNLVLSVDGDTLARYREDERSARLLMALRKARIFEIDEAHQQDMAALTVRSSSLVRYYDVPGHTARVLDTLYNSTEPDVSMPEVRMSQQVLDKAANRYGMMVALRWPRFVAPQDAAAFATENMQRFASGVNLNGNRRMNTARDMVYVAASREQGITIETNPLGICGLYSYKGSNEQASEITELWQHNIYSPRQQLACLMGAVSFATADLHSVDK